jgi:hypothetical protein
MVPYTTFSSSGLWCRNISAPSRWGIAPRLMLRQLQYSLPSLKRSFGLSGEVPEASSNYGTPPRFGRPFAELLLSTCDRVEIRTSQVLDPHRDLPHDIVHVPTQLFSTLIAVSRAHSRRNNSTTQGHSTSLHNEPLRVQQRFHAELPARHATPSQPMPSRRRCRRCGRCLRRDRDRTHRLYDARPGRQSVLRRRIDPLWRQYRRGVRCQGELSRAESSRVECSVEGLAECDAERLVVLRLVPESVLPAEVAK